MSDEQSGDLLTERMESTTPATTDNQGDAGSEGRETPPSGTDGSRDLPGWRKQLTPELQQNKALDKFDGDSPISKLAAGYIEAEGRLGKSIIVPGENASEEERSRFLSRLRGVETKDDYTLPDVQVPEQFKTLESAEQFKEMVYGLGLRQEQAAKLYEYNATMLNKGIEMGRQVIAKHVADAKAELQKEWPGDDYEKNMEIATRAMKTFLSEDEIKDLQVMGQGNDPRLWKRWYKVGSKLGEGSLRGNTTPAASESQGMQFPLARKIAEEARG